MLNKNQASDIFDRIRKFSTADEVEAIFYGGHSALTRFANNTIHQNVDEDNVAVSVRTVFGGRTARATTNKFDEESLRRVVKASESLARVQEPDADLLPMEDADRSVRATPVNRYFEQTAAVTPELRADGVGKIVDIAQEGQSDDRGNLFFVGSRSRASSIRAGWRSGIRRRRRRFRSPCWLTIRRDGRRQTLPM